VIPELNFKLINGKKFGPFQSFTHKQGRDKCVRVAAEIANKISNYAAPSTTTRVAETVIAFGGLGG